MDKRFMLSPGERCLITVLDGISLVRVPLAEHDVPKHIKKRAHVAAGECIATHTSPNIGDLHAPFGGVIKDVTSAYIEIEAAAPPAQEKAGEAPEGKDAAAPAAPVASAPVSPVSFDGLDAVALGKVLKTLGISVRPFIRPCDVFIINALNPEPGMLYTQEMLASYMPTVEAGFALAQRLSGSPKYVLALPENSPITLQGATPHHVRAVYPISLARPLIRAITGKEHTGRITLVRLHNLFLLGLVAQSGLPLTHTVITALGKNYLAPVGTPLSVFFDQAGFHPEPGDSVIIGGAMRGSAVAGITRGIGKGDDAMQLVKKGSMPPLEDNPCIGCGACVSVCPVRLRPNMLSRYAEFEQYENCRKEFIDVCIECGMCGYICPACRPMQQYFRMAKHHLGIRSHQHVLGQ